MQTEAYAAGLIQLGVSRSHVIRGEEEAAFRQDGTVKRSRLRHLLPGEIRADDDKPRRIAALDEICAIFKQPADIGPLS